MSTEGRGGFTLLEVMVSMAVLALALTAIAGINATAFDESNYAKHVTTATLLARSKMIDVEEKLRKDGFSDDEKEYSGDFEPEGYPGIKWTAVARRTDVDIAQLVGGLFGGDVSTDSLPQTMQSFLGAMKGEGPPELKDKVGGSELSKLLSGGGLELIYKQVADTLGKSIREITLEITWGKKGVDEENLKFVEYVVTTGRLAIPQGGAAPSLGTPANANNPQNANGTQQPQPGDRTPNTLMPPLPAGVSLPPGMKGP